ncbi:MAG: aspartate aminotransferase family protein [Actinomycetota bacterium]|nr:aspartate aminotransferase family protein [Actinomycetota bacterium]
MSDNESAKIPEKGLPRSEVLETLRNLKGEDANYKDSKLWSLVYYLGDEHTQFLLEAFSLFFSENLLNPIAFKSLKRLEHEIVRMTASLLSGDTNVVGTVTAGGTESCLLPVVAYRERAFAKHLFRTKKPEMIAPESVHVAWEKGAHYFGVKMVHAPLRSDLRVDVEAVKKLINKHTVLIVASAPSYPHGVIDPIAELGKVAQEYDIPLHVDSCLGGFMLPFLEKLGYKIPPFDFRVPGVTSISADVHKYGYGAKGLSVVLYRNMDYLKHQFFVYENWPGGIFISPALLGTRPGGPIAAGWAAMKTLGMDGYCDVAQRTMNTTVALEKGIQSIPELKILSNPEMSVFAYGSKSRKVNIFAVGDQMEEKGWFVDRLQRPEALHAIVTLPHEHIVDEFTNDLKESVEYVRNHPSLAVKGNAALYGMIAKVPLRGMVKKEALKIMEKMYGPDMTMPY